MAEQKSPSFAWLIFFGILLIITGIFAIFSPAIATFATIIALGIFLLIAGIFQLIMAFASHKSDSFTLNLVISIFAIVLGALILFHPTESVATITLLLAAFFFAIGIFRIINALVRREINWGWVLLNGIVSVILGIIIISNWPVSALWVIGVLIGIEFLFSGWTYIMLACLTKRATNS